ncbi:MAG TPA: class I SAM-dependent methyltransferase [Methylophilus sp.]
MSLLNIIFSLALTLNLSLAHADTSQRYQQYPPTAEGIGKVYMGREISHVMGYQGAAWLERESREKEERTDVLINTSNLQPGMVVADIGAGTGFLSRQMAAKVGASGKVFAVDVQPEMVAKLKKLAKTYQNIQPLLSQARGVDLPKQSVDLVIMVDVYHELAFPYEVIQSVLPALKPNGRLVLVEYRAEDDRVPIKATHKMSEAQVIKEMRVHPLKWQQTYHDLPWQHIVVFTAAPVRAH